MTQAERRSRTRNLLRQSARQQFAEVGYGAVSIDRLAEVVGLSRGAFYGHYRSKQDLLLDLMSEDSVRESQEWIALIAKDQTITELLDDLEKRFNLYCQSDDGVLHAEFQMEAHRNADFAHHFEEYHAKMLEITEGMLTKLVARVDRPIMDLKTLSVTHLALCHWLLFSPPNREAPGRVLRHFLESALGLAGSTP